MKVGDSGVQVEKSLGPLDLPETQLGPFLTSCGPMRLFDQVIAASGRDHLLVIDVIQRRKLADGRPITCQLISTDCFWDVIFTQQTLEE